MLGRAADGLFWMFRYTERAENIARLIDAATHMALTHSYSADDGWESVLQSVGGRHAYGERYDTVSGAQVIDFLLRDPGNPSSVLNCVQRARDNARTVRTALTRDVWESTNEFWLDTGRLLGKPVKAPELPETLDAIKRHTALIRGAFQGTMLRNEIFDFARLGTYLERADNTARILDVKYYVLLPAVSFVGSSLDNVQWDSILRSVSAHRSYRWVYDGDIEPTKIAEYLILSERMPRSLTFCYQNLRYGLASLERDYGERHRCHDTVAAMLGKLEDRPIAEIFTEGLHEFLKAFIECNSQIGTEIAEAYRFY